jgi:hypothetical protein
MSDRDPATVGTSRGNNAKTPTLNLLAKQQGLFAM